MRTIQPAPGFSIIPLLQESMALDEDDLPTVAEDLGLGPEFPAFVEHISSKRSTDYLPASILSTSALPSIKKVALSTAMSSMPPPKLVPYRTHKKNLQRAIARLPENRKASEYTKREHVQLADEDPVERFSIDTSTAGATRGAYSAMKEEVNPVACRKYTVESFREEHPDFTYKRWNGKDALPLSDENGTIFTVRSGRPNRMDYLHAADEALLAMKEVADSTPFKEKYTVHRRGGFAAINIGCTYGKGQSEPALLNTKPYAEMVDNLCANEYIQNLATFASASFQLWAPRVYDYYSDRLMKLYNRKPHLRHPVFPKSIFTSTAFNFSSNVWSYQHRDVMNCPFGFCSIVALGDFDATEGGHLILWEPKVILEFPHGSTILIPSATITHSNIPVQEGDTRMSFTQYCAGGLFRFVDNGFRTEKTIKKQSQSEWKELESLKSTRWKQGISLLSTVQDIMDTD